jgi:hypothetical protein
VPIEFGPPAAELSQGDLVERAPSVHVASLDHIIKIDANRYELRSEAPLQLDLAKKHPANANAVRAPALVLSHDCEIDKNPARATLLLAIIRWLDGVPEEHRDGFRANTRQRAVYLGAPNVLGDRECYADLRIITTVRRDAFEQLSRVASMSEDGRRMLREHLFRFFTRRLLPEEWLGWEEEA